LSGFCSTDSLSFPYFAMLSSSTSPFLRYPPRHTFPRHRFLIASYNFRPPLHLAPRVLSSSHAHTHTRTCILGIIASRRVQTRSRCFCARGFELPFSGRCWASPTDTSPSQKHIVHESFRWCGRWIPLALVLAQDFLFSELARSGRASGHVYRGCWGRNSRE